MIPKPLRKLVFGIPADETKFSKRGFTAISEEVRQRLEYVGETFVFGYHSALKHDDQTALAQELDTLPNEMRGFAYEGAGMALTLLDFLSPFKRNRFQNFVQGVGEHHVYMIYVGAGWAWARLFRNVNKAVTKLDPLLGWLAVDGYGFHEGYFHWQQRIDKQQIPKHLHGTTKNVFDQGLGRCLWFVKGANIDEIVKTIQSFDSQRHADLWGGLGLAVCYAGGVDEASIKHLAKLAGPFQPQLAQGVAFAAKARLIAGNSMPHNELACKVLCHSDIETAAKVTDDALIDLPYHDAEPAYQLWRQRIQANYT